MRPRSTCPYNFFSSASLSCYSSFLLFKRSTDNDRIKSVSRGEWYGKTSCMCIDAIFSPSPILLSLCFLFFPLSAYDGIILWYLKQSSFFKANEALQSYIPVLSLFSHFLSLIFTHKQSLTQFLYPS